MVIYNREAAKGTLLCANMFVNKTGKIAEHGNSIIVMAAAKIKTALIIAKIPVFFSKASFILFDIFSDMPPSLHTAPFFLDFKNSLNKYQAPAKDKMPIKISMLFIYGLNIVKTLCHKKIKIQ